MRSGVVYVCKQANTTLSKCKFIPVPVKTMQVRYALHMLCSVRITCHEMRAYLLDLPRSLPHL